MIEMTGVTRTFGSFTALDKINLNIREGEFFSLLGPTKFPSVPGSELHLTPMPWWHWPINTPL